MGSGIQSEQALLQEFRGLAGPHGGRIALCDDLATCDLLVIDETSTMRAATLRLAAERPSLQVWLRDPVGTLREARDPAQLPLDEATVTRTLLDLLGAAPAAVEAPVAVVQTALASGLRALAGRGTGAACLRLRGQDAVLFDCARGSAVMLAGSIEDIGEPLARRPQDLALFEFPADAVEDAARDLPRVPLATLLWQIGRQAAGDGTGWAWPGLGDEIALRLHKWPDVRLLAHRHDDFRLCSILVRQAATPLQCAEWLGLDVAQVRAFFHGAYLSGYASAAQTEAPASAQAAAPRKRVSGLAGLWRSVRQRMGG